MPFGSALEWRSRTTYRPTVTPEGSTHVDMFTGTTDLRTVIGTSSRSSSRPTDGASDAAPAMRVLLVEDDPMVGAALVGRLEDDAYAVDWVQRAQPGLDSLLTHTYDVVLLDLGLPELDGAGFLSAAAGPRGRHTAVIVVTARSEVESRIAGLDLGADDYLVKPFARVN